MRLAAALFLIVGVLGATETRVVSMGAWGDFLIDEANVDGFPSDVTEHGALLAGEYGLVSAYEDKRLRAIIPLGDEARLGNLGVLLNKVPTGALNWRLGQQYKPEPGIEAVYGFSAGQWSLGAAAAFMERYSNSNTDSADARVVEGKGGATYRFDADNFVQAGAAYARVKARELTDTSGAGDFGPVFPEIAGGAAYALRARAFFGVDDQLTAVPSVYYYRDDLSNSESLRVYSEYTAAGAVELSPVHGLLLIMGPAYHAWSETFTPTGPGVDVHSSFNGVSAFAALEAEITTWFTVRLGARKYFWSRYVLDDVETNANTLYYQTGVALSAGDLRLDGLLDTRFLYSGPYFIGGESRPLLRVSLLYRFRLF